MKTIALKCENCQKVGELLPNKTKDLSGVKFGKLLVCCFAGRSKHGDAMWYCTCDCGVKTGPVLSNNIKRGQTSTCGCGERESQLKPPGVASWTYLYRNHIGNSNTRKHVNEISRDAFIKLCTKACFYCEEPPIKWNKYIKQDGSLKNIHEGRSKDTIDRAWVVYNGIDRVDSSKGYPLDNCVTCCYICNRAKSDMSIEEWIKYVGRYSVSVRDGLIKKLNLMGIFLK